MVYRVFVEKRPGFAPEASNLLADVQSFLGLTGVKNIRILNRYDVEDIDEELFAYARNTVFAEPQLDIVSDTMTLDDADVIFGVEAQPGQFDQRADSAAQCIQLLSQGDRPLVAFARIYGLYGDLSEDDVKAIKHYVINPVETREASLELPETLKAVYPQPETVETIHGFIQLTQEELKDLLGTLGLAMDLDDLCFLQRYFKEEEQRDPTITEVRVVDTYWSDHCRHTTFSTHLDHTDLQDELVKEAYTRYQALRNEVYGENTTRPETLMDLATIGAKALKRRGELPELDESEEINACSIHVPAEVDGKTEDWLLMFKNETHNHPTEIEPFGGAATCIGGCIRDPLSGRVFVHQAMRYTGGGDPRASLKDTLEGKLPQRKIAQTAAAGYSSYGNQIGLATGHVAEVYHEGYIAKRLECGAVIGAAKADNVVRERPQPGDIVILLGGRTGRDGIGGATGSSKPHNLQSLETMASEVQKGNAPEERKIQRLFRNPEVTRMIKRCNDFGAGGVSVAIGELADGLKINLDTVRKKYEGLDGTELAISESQERMAVVIAAENEERFIEEAGKENLEAYKVAVVTEEPRMVMSWKGRIIADLSRSFLNANGAVKHADVAVTPKDRSQLGTSDIHDLQALAESLKSASRRGLVERFDSTIGAGSVLMPFGGETQSTPAQVMAAMFPVLPGHTTNQASVMAWGADPDQMMIDPYLGAYNAVYTSVAKLVAAGADYEDAYLTFQEFFERLRDEPERWGKPFSALLGALDAQMELKIAAIGGKDSMSGSFLDKDVPPTLISFAIAPILAENVLSPEFKDGNHGVYFFDKNQWKEFHELCRKGQVKAGWAVENSISEGIMKMSFGNRIGFVSDDVDLDWYKAYPGAIIAEIDGECSGLYIGRTTVEPVISIDNDYQAVKDLYQLNEKVLADVYPTEVQKNTQEIPVPEYRSGMTIEPLIHTAKPKALIPVFPGTNCEYDTARALMEAGGDAEIVIIRNLSSSDVSASVDLFAKKVRDAQMIIIPGGFSGGDEPDGSAKFITAFFRNPAVKESVSDLLDCRGGLMLGICNGFQALIKLGLVPYGKIIDTDETCPTLTYNTIGRHQSRIVRTRIASNLSPWLSELSVGDICSVPISHGEGRFIAGDTLLQDLMEHGQIATQYVDLQGNPTMDTDFNPNGSFWAVEGITSPDGRVFGKMGHAERIGSTLYKNVPGNYEMGLFRSAVRFFK
ncbi:MAG: phosphoribosylformylglycinamidine synthase [Solobacterium sp.]|nr:phosphoribosylformylglycinamidine synthase [Solobacterium sp.]